MAGVEIGWVRQLSTETRPWAIDLFLEMDQGDVVGTVTSSLTDLLTGAAFPTGLLGNPVAAGTVVTQSVQSLVAGHNYRLVVSANMGGSKVTSTALNLACPY